MEAVTLRMLTAVWTLLETASMRDERRNMLSDSFFFLIALAAYIRAPSAFPCCIAFFSFAFSAASSFAHFLACRCRALAVNWL